MRTTVNENKWQTGKPDLVDDSDSIDNDGLVEIPSIEKRFELTSSWG